MNKFGSLESQLMDAFKKDEEDDKEKEKRQTEKEFEKKCPKCFHLGSP